MTIKLWTDGEEAGFLDRSRESGSAFVYRPGAPPNALVRDNDDFAPANA